MGEFCVVASPPLQVWSKFFVVATKKTGPPSTKTKRKERGKMKNKLLSFGVIFALTIATISPARAISLTALKNSLSKYCIASPEACGTITAPIFDTRQNACTCYNSDFQQYDANERKCVIKCPPGTFRREMKASGSCPAGYFLSSNCPSGTRKVLLQKRALKSYEFGG